MRASHMLTELVWQRHTRLPTQPQSSKPCLRLLLLGHDHLLESPEEEFRLVQHALPWFAIMVVPGGPR